MDIPEVDDPLNIITNSPLLGGLTVLDPPETGAP
jgi:hypothetical protein